jgi:hypothetical protein
LRVIGIKLFFSTLGGEATSSLKRITSSSQTTNTGNNKLEDYYRLIEVILLETIIVFYK